MTFNRSLEEEVRYQVIEGPAERPFPALRTLRALTALIQSSLYYYNMLVYYLSSLSFQGIWFFTTEVETVFI